MKAYKKVNDISKHCQYQLSSQGLGLQGDIVHASMTDFAWKLVEFIRYEVDEKLGEDLNDKWSNIAKLNK